MNRARCSLMVIGLLAVAGWNGAGPTWANGGPPPRPAGKAVVVGGITPCFGLPVRGGPRYAAGTVTVLKGRVIWKHSRENGWRWIFPTQVVGRAQLATNQMYRFVLAPGPYVLKARYAPPANVSPFVQVSARQGRTVHADIPNMCI